MLFQARRKKNQSGYGYTAIESNVPVVFFTRTPGMPEGGVELVALVTTCSPSIQTSNPAPLYEMAVW
jgi:hypothetical protein